MRTGLPLMSLARDVTQTVREGAITGLLHLATYRPVRSAHPLRQLTAATHTVGHRTPVVLVHGFGGNASTWSVLERRLSLAGFTSLHVTVYSPFARCVPDVARALVTDCHDAMQRADTDQ